MLVVRRSLPPREACQPHIFGPESDGCIEAVSCRLRGGVRTPIRSHGMLDDGTRYFVPLEAHASECKLDMLHRLTRALLLEGKPDALSLHGFAVFLASRGESL